MQVRWTFCCERREVRRLEKGHLQDSEGMEPMTAASVDTYT